jgi:hypothetical protein
MIKEITQGDPKRRENFLQYTKNDVIKHKI